MEATNHKLKKVWLLQFLARSMLGKGIKKKNTVLTVLSSTANVLDTRYVTLGS